MPKFDWKADADDKEVKMQKMETKKVGMSTQMSRKRSDFSLLIKVKVMILNSQTKNAHIQLYHLYT